MPDSYAVTVEAVKRSLKDLREKRTHRLFPGYLAIYQTLKREGEEPGTFVRVDFNDFYDAYFQIPGSGRKAGGKEYPWINLFIEDSPSDVNNLWRRDHLMGSYGPSSLKALPLKSIDARGVRETSEYTLRDGHSTLALEHSLYGTKVSATRLAIFLYRDYCFEGDPPTLGDLVSHFQRDFGFLDEAGEPNDDFKALFLSTEEDDLTSLLGDHGSESDLFEECVVQPVIADMALEVDVEPTPHPAT